jgi:diguanylate cyclase (GGDEF)-like protein
MKKSRLKRMWAGQRGFYARYVVLALLGTELIFILQAKVVLKLPVVAPQGYILPAVVGMLFGYLLARVKILSKNLQEENVTDSLTDVHNRLWLNEHLEAEVYRCKRYEGELAVIVLDVDHLKEINDIYGHQAGDAVLVEIAGLLRGHDRASDMFVRYGGEVFLQLLPNTSLDGARAVAGRMRKAIEAHTFSSAEVLTCSFGVTVFLPETDSNESFLGRADEALRQAKEGGRNRVVALP